MVLASAQARHTMDPEMFERTVIRLLMEFVGAVSRSQVESALRGSLADLSGSPIGAMPELSERLARQRLADGLDGRAQVPEWILAPR